jgi:multidrug efflux pump subunit AcrA (membrane-fusion protein)
MNKLLIKILAFAFLPAMFSCGKKEEIHSPSIPTIVNNVEISKVTKSSTSDFYEATGTVKAKTTTQVSANMMGRIIYFPFREGDLVSRGQILVEIDNREAEAQLQKAKAGLQEAKASLIEIDKSTEAALAGVKTAEANKQLAEVTFGRFKTLYERKSASPQEFDEAQARLKMAVSELERAKAGIQTILSKKKQINAKIEQAKADINNTKVYQSYSRIVSPVSGLVVKKFAEPGATAAPGAPLLSIEDNSQYLLEAAVEESRSKLVRLGNRVGVKIDALGQGEIFGTIAEILPSAEAASRSYTVKISLPVNSLLKTGLYGLAIFPGETKESIAIPNSAIVNRGQLSGVYAVNPEGIAVFRIVTIGKTAEGKTEILSGLSEGDEIVTSDLSKVSDGVKIK